MGLFKKMSAIGLSASPVVTSMLLRQRSLVCQTYNVVGRNTGLGPGEGFQFEVMRLIPPFQVICMVIVL